MYVKILSIDENDEGHLFVDWQCACGPDRDVMNKRTGPFDGDDPWEDIRLWLAMNGESEARKRRPEIPVDLDELVGRDTDTSELRQRFKPQMDRFNEQAAEAARQVQERRQG